MRRCICEPMTVWRRHASHLATISGSIIASDRIRALTGRLRITSISRASRSRRRREFAAVAWHRSGRATPSLRNATQRQSMERIGRESIYRDRNAVQTKPATSEGSRQTGIKKSGIPPVPTEDGDLAERVDTRRRVPFDANPTGSLGCDYDHSPNSRLFLSLPIRPVRPCLAISLRTICHVSAEGHRSRPRPERTKRVAAPCIAPEDVGILPPH